MKNFLLKRFKDSFGYSFLSNKSKAVQKRAAFFFGLPCREMWGLGKDK